jgi:hypothetical protein
MESLHFVDIGIYWEDNIKIDLRGVVCEDVN